MRKEAREKSMEAAVEEDLGEVFLEVVQVVPYRANWRVWPRPRQESTNSKVNISGEFEKRLQYEDSIAAASCKTWKQTTVSEEVSTTIQYEHTGNSI